jgi:peptidoglycan-binding protein ArfA
MPDRFDRRAPGAAYLVALVAIPLLLAAIGWVLQRPLDAGVAADAPSVNPSKTLTAPGNAGAGASETAPPEMNFAPLSIAQTGEGFTLGGELPNQEAKTSLSESLRLAFGSGLEVTDNTIVRPGVNAPDFAALGSILGAAVGVSEFTFDLKGDAVTLSGTASTDDAKTEVQSAVKAAWPKMKIVNNIRVK